MSAYQGPGTWLSVRDKAVTRETYSRLQDFKRHRGRGNSVASPRRGSKNRGLCAGRALTHWRGAVGLGMLLALCSVC